MVAKLDDSHYSDSVVSAVSYRYVGDTTALMLKNLQSSLDSTIS